MNAQILHTKITTMSTSILGSKDYYKFYNSEKYWLKSKLQGTQDHQLEKM